MQRQKPLKLSLSRSEQKAAQVDTWVKADITRRREAEKAKTSRLKALREAHDATRSKPEPSCEENEISPQQSQKMRRMWISGSDPSSDPKRHDL
jgi:hypothetical protein